MPVVPVSPDVSAAAALIPEGWLAIEGLACGFGGRATAPPDSTLLLQRQVHGTRMVDPALDTGRLRGDDGLARVAGDGDALIAASAGTVVGIRTADCVPLLLVAPRAHWAAAVHAGWRGTLAGIATEAVDAARRAGIGADELVAALGPSIGPCCYEVSAELGEEFRRAGFPDVTASGSTGHSPSRPHLDLRRANRFLLERSGVPAHNVQVVGPCTRCAYDRYHSFRAEPGSAGRQISWVGWKAKRD